MEKDFRVLLYYQYVPIDDPEGFKKEHMVLCKDLGLLGRIIVAKEGLNGTVSGSYEATQAYMDTVHKDPRFESMPFKMDDAESHAFSKMHVRVKPELVNLSLEEDINPLNLTGQYLEPMEFNEKMKQENTLIIDARNDYEYDLGHFEGAIKPDITAFRELPKWIKDNKELLEGKEIITYCTGGVRCEKFSGWLKAEGHQDVGQLHGGIVTYGYDQNAQGELWNGQCYVFDERIAVPINRINPNIVGKDLMTGEPCQRYVNCANPKCNKQIFMSETTEKKYLRSCSDKCRKSSRNRYVLEHKLSQEEISASLAIIQ